MPSRLPLLVFGAMVAVPFDAGAALTLAIDIAPPPLPVYAQPVIPAPGYLWTPGYWRWNPAFGEYVWVPGAWVAPPFTGALWTPGYWGWAGGSYAWHGGYWGTRVGFYGGVNYGFGYVGSGYQGGYWNGGVFNYNRSVNNVNPTFVRNVYNTTVVENNTRVSYNGGQGGIAARPTAEERAVQHVPPTAAQHQHEQAAFRSPAQRASFDHGAPASVAMAPPRDPGGGRRGPPHGPEGQGAGPGGYPHDGGRAAAPHREMQPERHEHAR